MATKLTSAYLKKNITDKIHGDVLHSEEYGITTYYIPKNGILTVVSDFTHKEKHYISYIVLSGSIKFESDTETIEVKKGDALEIDSDTDYFMVESEEGAIVLCVENGTSTYVEDMSKQLKDQITAYEKSDRYAAASSIDVMRIATIISAYLPWKIDVDKLSKAALIHDMGKMEIDKKILNKPGKLTEEEFEIVKQHPEKALKYLKGTFDDPIIRDAVFEHHERLDGSGYPCGLKDNDISREAKVLMVADMYSALTNTRVYRRNKFTSEEAYEIIENDCNKNKLDKDVVLALRKALNAAKYDNKEIL